MICSECGYLHAPYSVDDIMTEGFMDKFIRHQKYMSRLGDKMIIDCKNFDILHKIRIRLENYNFKHNGLTTLKQKEWNDLEISYIKARDDRTNSIQAFVNTCKHQKLELPEWLKDHKWLTV